MMESLIAQRIEQIVTVFKTAREMAEGNGLSDTLRKHLVTADEYYRSVAFEGAAMGLAVRDISLWEEFLKNDGAPHAVQVHIGLGWALAEQQRAVPENPTWPDPDSVLDGYGYYHGLFRRRLSIRTQGIPDGLDDAQLPAFDRGLGRSLWYISKGDVELLQRMVTAFSEERQPNLWRGIGIAVTFVGGCDELLLRQVHAAAGVFHHQLGEGAVRAAKSRSMAGTPLEDAELVCRAWLVMDVGDILT